MKKGIILLVFSLFAILGFTAMGINKTYATDVSTILMQDLFSEAKEKQEVASLFEKELPNVKQIIKEDSTFLSKKHQQKHLESIPENLGTPYKVYLVSPEKLNNYQANKQLELNDYTWEVPMFDKMKNIVMTSTAWNYNGTWEIAQIGLTMPEEMVQLSSDSKAIVNLLNNTNLLKAKEVKHIRIPFILDAFYVSLETGEEYFIPLTHHNVLDLEDLKPYYAKDVIDQINSK